MKDQYFLRCFIWQCKFFFNLAGIRDSSGLRIFYTSQLRTYDAGCLMLGSAVTPRMFIPPGQETYDVTGHTNTECLAPVSIKITEH